MQLHRTIRRLAVLALGTGAVCALAGCHRDALPIAKAPPEAAHPVIHTVDGEPAYVGRWALTAAECARRPWVLSVSSLQTPGAFRCSLEHVEPTPAGYTVDGICQVGTATAPGRLVFTLTRLGGPSLTVSGGPFPEPVALARCPDAVASAGASTGDEG